MCAVPGGNLSFSRKAASVARFTSATHDTPASGSSVHLRLDGVSHSYGDRRVLTDVSLVVDATERVGLIGENGAGKSTLLRLLARVEEPDAGIVSSPGSLGLLRQQPEFAPSQRLGDVLDAAFADLARGLPEPTAAPRPRRARA